MLESFTYSCLRNCKIFAANGRGMLVSPDMETGDYKVQQLALPFNYRTVELKFVDLAAKYEK